MHKGQCLKDTILLQKTFIYNTFLSKPWISFINYTFHVVHIQMLFSVLKTLDVLHMELALYSKQALCIYNPLYTVVTHGTETLRIEKAAKQAHG